MAGGVVRSAGVLQRGDKIRVTLARKFFPQLDVAFALGKPVDYAWLVSTVDKKRIVDAAKPFFDRIVKDGTLSHA